MTYEEIRAFSGMAGLLLFGITFMIVLVWVLRPSAKNSFEEQGKIPFTEDENHDRNN